MQHVGLLTDEQINGHLYADFKVFSTVSSSDITVTKFTLVCTHRSWTRLFFFLDGSCGLSAASYWLVPWPSLCADFCDDPGKNAVTHFWCVGLLSWVEV